MTVVRIVMKSLVVCAVIAAGVVALDQYQGRRFEVTDSDQSRFTLVTWKYWGMVQEMHQVRYNVEEDTWELEENGQRVSIDWEI